MIFRKAHHNTFSVTKMLLRGLGIKITNTTLRKPLESHPDYPTLLSINDTCKDFRVSCEALSVDRQRFHELPVPFIADTINSKEKFVVVNKIGESAVELSSTSGITTASVPLASFLENITGNVLLAKAGPGVGQSYYFINRPLEIVKENLGITAILLLFASGLLSCYFSFQSTAFRPLAISQALFLSGVIITSILLDYEITQNDELLSRICIFSPKYNCSKILNSKYSKIFGAFSFSEMGFIFFTGAYLSELTLGQNALPFVALLIYFSLPYVIFSVFIQGTILRHWCSTCLTVMFILLCLSACMFLFGVKPASFSNFDPSKVLTLALNFLFPTLIWIVGKNYNRVKDELKNKNKELARFKRNGSVFSTLLSKERKITIDDSVGITLGNQRAKNSLVKVCNPFCGPCSQSHHAIKQLLESNHEIKLQVIFFPNKANIRDLQIVRHFFAIYVTYGRSLVTEAFDYWYSEKNKDFDKLLEKFPTQNDTEPFDVELTKMSDWCTSNGVKFTPTFFFNGFELPSLYSIEDLRHQLL